MNAWGLLGATTALLSLTACGSGELPPRVVERLESQEGAPGLVMEDVRIAGVDVLAEEVLCARRIASQPRCNVDFARLAAFHPFVDQLRISITGFLVVDGRLLTLYATEQDYRLQIRSRGVELRVVDEEERDQFAGLLDQYVNVDGVYSRDFESNNVRGRLGYMRGPFRLYEVKPHLADEGIDDVLFSLVQSGEAQPQSGTPGAQGQ